MSNSNIVNLHFENSTANGVNQKCYNVIKNHLSLIPDLTGNILQISNIILSKSLERDCSNNIELINNIIDEYSKIILPSINQPNSKTLRRKFSLTIQLKNKLKIAILSDEEMLLSAGFKPESAELILNMHNFELTKMLKNQSKIAKISNTEKEERALALNELIKQRSGQVNIMNLSDNSGSNYKEHYSATSYTQENIEFYQNYLEDLAKNFQMSAHLINNIKNIIKIAIKNQVFKYSFLPTIFKKAIPKIYEGVIINLYGSKVASFLKKIKELIIQDLIKLPKVLKFLTENAKLSTVLISEIRNLTKINKVALNSNSLII